MDAQDSKEKSKLTLSLNKDVIQRAKAAGINISEITEKLLTAVTLNPSGNSYKDVVEAYMAFYESLKNTLQKYNAQILVLDYPDEAEAIMLRGEGFIQVRDSPEGATWEDIVEVHQVMNLLDNPIELLDKVINALIGAAEKNKEQIAKLQFALKLLKALSEEEKGENKK